MVTAFYAGAHGRLFASVINGDWHRTGNVKDP
jgi:hypothetical protein